MLIILAALSLAVWLAPGAPRLVDVSRQILPPGSFISTTGWLSDHEIAVYHGPHWKIIGIAGGKRTDGSEVPEQRYGEIYDAIQKQTVMDHNTRDPRMMVAPESAPLLEKLPAHSEVYYSLVSPGRDRRAWIVIARHPSLIERVKSSLLRQPGPVGESRFEIWISEADGERPRLLGVADNILGKNGDTLTNWIDATVYWSPDSRQLSFEYHRSLWVAAID